jgi:hypothetical protein
MHAGSVCFIAQTCYINLISNWEATVNRKELEMRIWGKSIAYARANGLISEAEAQFLLDEYLKEFKAKSGWTWQKHFNSLLGTRRKSWPLHERSNLAITHQSSKPI